VTTVIVAKSDALAPRRRRFLSAQSSYQRADRPLIRINTTNRRVGGRPRLSHSGVDLAVARAPRPPVAAEDASVIAAKMKIGVELMTYGEVAAARVMFQRAAEAGDGAGAFALAETYDPLVLGGLRLREGIMPDLALARAWYERARDLGSLEARDRISRLAQLPQ
jgi:TPR repeat protein